MKIEIAKHERMSESGSSILRLIQNNDMPILDLLIRESVQNSLDASEKGTGYVEVDFRTGDFDKENLITNFDKVEDNLRKLFPKKNYRFLEIRDYNTTGLTGPLHVDEVKNNDFGNLLKLIYEISKPQQKEGSGGSWGLGKTVYFRIGIGLVIYYTRIKAGRTYSSRLAACLVEDENKSSTIIPKGKGRPHRGIAWWGQKAKGDTTMPVTDENEIKKILEIFDIEPYKDKETGTTIVIPFIDEKKLLKSVVSVNTEQSEKSNQRRPWWCDSLEEYIKVALQRWYVPRLSNQKYKNGKWLRSKVNGIGIKSEDMLPLFRTVQALYNRALSKGNWDDEDILSQAECTTKEIFLKNEFTKGGCAGYLSYAKLNSRQLLMTYPENHPSPYVQLNNYEINDDLNHPIIMFTRKPGMIVGYETTGKWTDGINKTPKDEFIIGIFVANSDNILKAHDSEDLEMSLEEYIRSNEKADHTSWSDGHLGQNMLTIISKIQLHVRKNISDTFTQQIKNNGPVRKTGLGRVLAEMLLPPENFGRLSSFGGGNGGHGALGHGIRKFGLKVNGNPTFTNGQMRIDFELRCGKKTNPLLVQLQVMSEGGVIEAEKWESDEIIGKPFPLKLEKFEIHEIKNGKKIILSQNYSVQLSGNVRSADACGFRFKKLVTGKGKVSYGVSIETPQQLDYILTGSAYFSTSIQRVQGSLNVVEIEEDIDEHSTELLSSVNSGTAR